MHIELIGCTGAGKTTLTKKIFDMGKQQGVDILLGDDFVLQRLHLKWVKNEFMRRRIEEICAAYICLRHWQKYRRFYHFVSTVVKETPGSLIYKINLLRIVLRKIGIYELIQRSNSENQILLVDNEGIIQAAHNLFVHTNSINGNVTNFIHCAPLPDMIVYLRQPQPVLIERTLRRGHPRIRENSHQTVQFFIRQATETFDKLQTLPEIENRLFVIDGKSRSVIKKPSDNGHLVNQTYNLMKKSIMNNHFEEEPGSPGHTDYPCLDLISHLAEQLHTQKISYCHWKSNINLNESLWGKEDLDFFVSSQSLTPFLNIISQLGFKEADIRFGPETEGVSHHYGFDELSGKLIHIHLFTNLLTGESFVKSHIFPFEKMFLENCHRVAQISVVSKPAELVLFVLRTFIKYGSLPDMLRLAGNSANVCSELKWLLDKDNLSKALDLLKTFCPIIDESLFLECIKAIHENQSFLSKVFLAFRVRKRLQSYSKYTFVGRISAYGLVILAKLKCLLKGNLKNKTLSSGGSVIAFVGADATGKSTLVTETKRWLMKVFAVQKVHVGKPPSAFLTMPFNLSLALAGRLSPKLKRKHAQSRLQDRKSSKTDNKKQTSLLFAIRALSLAWDRYRLLCKVDRARASGEIIICDRYPSQQTGAMDSPRLEEHINENGFKIAIFNRLARCERKIYQKMPLPDIVIKLTVSLEIAKIRNAERKKGDKDSDEFIEVRHRNAHNWFKEGIKHNVEINTDQSISATILKAKKVVWESL
jgi:thymidylate kinase